MARGAHSAGAHSASKGRRGGTRRVKKRSKAPLVVVLVLALAVAGVSGGMAVKSYLAERNAYQGITGEVLEGQSVLFEVASGTSSTEIAENLVTSGVIGASADFVERVAELGYEGALMAGTYELVGGSDIDDIIEAFVNGDTATFTIPEGYTLADIAEVVGEQTPVDADEFYELASTGAADYVESYPFLENAYEGTMEGFLFPATYEISVDMTADELIRDMLDTCQATLASLDMDYAESKNLDYYDIVTLASIVQKESQGTDDMASISSVFYNRLKAGMNLGSDVTTYYAVGKDLTEELTASDLASDSPYNTRNASNTGLPAGPICSPGLDALEAAAHPDETDYYYYFFWSSSQDTTMFFESADEFNEAWAEYGQ